MLVLKPLKAGLPEDICYFLSQNNFQGGYSTPLPFVFTDLEKKDKWQINTFRLCL